ncbi:MAG: glycosyltransferase family 2 protein [Bacteroidia bacterium]
MNLAPIAFFVYNRPAHTKQTLDALAANDLSSESVLYVFADGAKENESNEIKERIREVRELIRKENRFKKIIIKESSNNKGLANSIIEGVTGVLNENDSVIVLEDDIKAGKGFLDYMNKALGLYANNDEVGCIHAWNYSFDKIETNDTTFFLRGADCWGWATWKRSWKLFNPDGRELLNAIVQGSREYSFNRNGTYPFLKMLEEQISGKNNSWAIRWHASLFLNNKYCLHPVRPIVENIGFDNSGTHCTEDPMKQHLVDFIDIKKIPVTESEWFFKAFSSYEKAEKAKAEKANRGTIWQQLKTLLRRLFRR